MKRLGVGIGVVLCRTDLTGVVFRRIDLKGVKCSMSLLYLSRARSTALR